MQPASGGKHRGAAAERRPVIDLQARRGHLAAAARALPRRRHERPGWADRNRPPAARTFMAGPSGAPRSSAGRRGNPCERHDAWCSPRQTRAGVSSHGSAPQFAAVILFHGDSSGAVTTAMSSLSRSSARMAPCSVRMDHNCQPTPPAMAGRTAATAPMKTAVPRELTLSAPMVTSLRECSCPRDRLGVGVPSPDAEPGGRRAAPAGSASGHP